MDSVKYVHTHNFKKRGHKFEKEWEAWMGGAGGRNNVNIVIVKRNFSLQKLSTSGILLHDRKVAKTMLF